MAFRFRRVWGRVAFVAAVASLAAGCASAPPDGHSTRKTDYEKGHVSSALSGYLAGRFAQGVGDSQAAAGYFAAALKHDPDNMELLQRSFGLMTTEGRLDVAAPLAERVLAFDADEPLPLVVAGLEDARNGRWSKAVSRFQLLPQRGIHGILGPLLLAWAKLGDGTDPAVAIDALDALNKTKGLEPLRAYHAALIADLGGKVQGAEDGYKGALSSQLSVRGIEAAGSWFQRSGRLDEAKAIYGRYAKEHPDSLLFDSGRLLAQGAAVARTVPTAQDGLAEALFDIASLMRQGNASELAMLYARLALWIRPDLALAQTTVGDLLTAHNRLAEANRFYLGVAPDLPAATYGRLRAAINLDDMNKMDQAVAELDRLSTSKAAGLEALVTKGDVLRRHKRFAEAAEAYGKAVERIGAGLQPHHWSLLYSRGISYERSKQWMKAEADFLAALRLKPEQPDVLNYLGYTWVDMGINLDRAKAMLEKAVELRPKDGAIVDSMGWALYRLGDFHGAVKILERAVELKPEDPTINDHLGDAYWQIGRAEEAMFQWVRASGLDPEPEQVDQLRLKIQTGEVPAKPAGHP
jgi:tetratricopeptide (TPR) repeat protein